MITISTKQGDQGKTSLYGGKRVTKNHPLIKLIGSIDELQVYIGWLKIQLKSSDHVILLTDVQFFLYQIMADMSGSKSVDNILLTKQLDKIENAQSEILKQTHISHKFVLPGQNKSEVGAHILRVKTRFCERLLCQESTHFADLKRFIPFFNRLSDYFFILSQFFI